MIVKLKHPLSTIFILMFACISYAQSDLAIGEWASYLPHNNIRYLTQSDDKVICGTDLSLYTIDKEDNSIEYISKVEGLTDAGLSSIEYDNFNDQLIVAYDNSTIDIINESEVFPVFDIKENTNFLDRRINDIYVQNESLAYFATGFGVVQYDLSNREFGFTLNANQKVSEIHGNDDILVMRTDTAVFWLDFQNEIFPNAFSSWTAISQGLPSDFVPTATTVVNNQIYLSGQEFIFKLDENFEAIVVASIPDGFQVRKIEETREGWIVGMRNSSNDRGQLNVFDDNDVLQREITSCTNRFRDALITEDGSIYFADDFDEVRFIDPQGNCQKVSFEGPFSAEASDINIQDDLVYVASGGITDAFGDDFGRKGVYILENGLWNNINQDSNPFFKDNDVIQHFQIEPHPREPIYYIGSFWAGLIEYNTETGEQVLYNASNTSGALGPPVGDNPDRVRISGLAFDDDENLWISVFGAERSIAVLTAEGTWHSFPVTSDTKVSDIVVDDVGYVWNVIAGNTGGVFVLDPGNSIPDPTDDGPSRFINSNNSEIPSNLVNAIVKDLDGAIWVGTAQGAVVFECGTTANESVCSGNRPTVSQDNIGAFLLETENIQAIAVDGANRKWFGTTNGIFVQSPNGEEQIANFDVDNSPLFDNSIKAMAFNSNSGEMIIATDKGLQSFKTATTGASEFHSSNVYAYPNPVRPDYSGPIAIKGLGRDAEVIITDVDGHLVFKTEALGGQAIWDGLDLKGQQVSGGVYLVFSASAVGFDESDSFVTKIMVIR